MAYVGWEKLTTDKSVTRIVGDAVVGEGTMESVSNKVDTAIEGVNDLKEKVGETVSTMNEAMTDVNSKWAASPISFVAYSQATAVT